jgi:hypothetical protein
MAQPRTIEVTLALPGEPTTAARATVLDRNPATRLGRAVAALLMAWAIAAACIFVPIVHFVAVPGFFLVGLGLFVLRALDGCTLVKLEGDCPRCKVHRDFPSRGRFRDGRQVHCEGCGCQLELKVVR